MRLLYLTDTHIKSVTPENRKDNFLETIYNKLLEVTRLCRDLKIDYVIHGGDVFDNPHPDRNSWDLLQWFLKELNCPLYCVAGNHDLINQQLDSLQKAALGSLARSKNIKLLQPREKIYLDNGNCIVQLSGQHYYGGMDWYKHSEDYIVKKKGCDLAIHVVHGMLVPKAFSDKVACTLISEVAATEADFTLGAHAHLGYQQTVNGKFFLNPGALARLTNLPRELNRRPQVLYLDFTTSAGYSFIPLKSALPGSDVMDIKFPEESPTGISQNST